MGNGAGMDSYNVVFCGEIADGFALDEVTTSLKAVFGISDEAKVKHLFSGNRAVLRKKLSRGDAWRFKEKLETIGIITDLEKIGSTTESGWLSFDETTDTAPAPQAKTQVAEPEPTASPPETPGLSLEPLDLTDPTGEEPPPTPEMATFRATETSPQRTLKNPAPVTATPSSLSRLSSSASVAAATVVADTNSSGGGSGVTAPPSTSGLCWGGFFFGWIWGAFNRTWFGLFGLIPLLNVPVAFILLFKGREWAWRNKRWESVEHFNEVQRKWTIAGIIFALLSGFLWFQFVQDASEFGEEEALQMEEQRQELRDKLDTIEDPEQRKQLEAIIQFQEQLQKELEKSQ
jgi:hypothetical protein